MAAGTVDPGWAIRSCCIQPQPHCDHSLCLPWRFSYSRDCQYAHWGVGATTQPWSPPSASSCREAEDLASLQGGSSSYHPVHKAPGIDHTVLFLSWPDFDFLLPVPWSSQTSLFNKAVPRGCMDPSSLMGSLVTEGPRRQKREPGPQPLPMQTRAAVSRQPS